MRKIICTIIFLLFSNIIWAQTPVDTNSVDTIAVEKIYDRSPSDISDTLIIPFEYDTILFNTLLGDVHGIDVSMWQNTVTWKHIPSKYKFAFIKATGGLKTDPNFRHNWNECPLIKGAYHFFNPYINGEAQAKHFLSVVKLEKGNLPPVIDVEYTSYWRKCNKNTASKNLKMMLDYIEKETGVRPIIYTNCNFWNKYVYPYFKGDISKYNLWVANYGKESPCLPKGWNNWTFWQYSCKGKMPNHSTYWDLNYYNGNNLFNVIIK